MTRRNRKRKRGRGRGGEGKGEEEAWRKGKVGASREGYQNWPPQGEDRSTRDPS